jgi:hypothetical protein
VQQRLGDVDASDTTAGYVLTREPDGSFALDAAGGSSSTKVFRRHLRWHE